jgi:hypothetical protein
MYEADKKKKQTNKQVDKNHSYDQDRKEEVDIK